LVWRVVSDGAVLNGQRGVANVDAATFRSCFVSGDAAVLHSHYAGSAELLSNLVYAG